MARVRFEARRPSHLGLEPGEDPQRLRVALEPAARGAELVQRALAVVPERRVPDVVGQPGGVDDVGVGAQLLGDAAADLRDLQRVRQPGPRDAADLGALPRADTCVFPASRRSAAECSTRARSRANGLRRPFPNAFGRSGEQAFPVVRAVARGAPTSAQAGGLGVHRRLGDRVVEQRARSPGRCSGPGSRGCAPPGRCRVGEVHACRPLSRAIVRARSECHGSLTTSAVSQPSWRARASAARRLPRVSVPSPTATTAAARHAALDQVAAAGLRLGVRVARAAAADGDDPRGQPVVVELLGVPQPGGRGPELGSPSYCAAPRTTTASTGAAVVGAARRTRRGRRCRRPGTRPRAGRRRRPGRARSCGAARRPLQPRGRRGAYACSRSALRRALAAVTDSLARSSADPALGRAPATAADRPARARRSPARRSTPPSRPGSGRPGPGRRGRAGRRGRRRSGPPRAAAPGGRPGCAGSRARRGSRGRGAARRRGRASNSGSWSSSTSTSASEKPATAVRASTRSVARRAVQPSSAACATRASAIAPAPTTSTDGTGTQRSSRRSAPSAGSAR